MCFIINNLTPFRKTAKRDISCYKYVIFNDSILNSADGSTDECCAFIFNSFKYKQGVEYNVKDDTQTYDQDISHFTESTIKMILSAIINVLCPFTTYLERGFHSFMATGIKNGKNYNVDVSNALFMIPKGAKYYINKKTNEYISDRIKYIKPLTIDLLS